jgi:hypothetical protein
MAATTLDVQLDPATKKEHDTRSVAFEVSEGAGIEYGIYKRFRGFAEIQTSLVYPSFDSGIGRSRRVS